MLAMMNPTPSSVPAPPPRQSAAVRWFARLPLLAYRAGLGGLADALHVLVLTTRGHKSGLARANALEYRVHGSRIYLLSTWGEQANWVRDLRADPSVTVQRGGQVFAALAEPVAQQGEALLALRLFYGTGPFLYDSIFSPMQALRGRTAVSERGLPGIIGDFTVIRLTPQPGAPVLPPLAGDLRWIPPAAGMLTTAGAVLGVALYAWHSLRARPADRD
jgi:deazaflavin-dependent oxidoreductase (nitroreductase family)